MTSLPEGTALAVVDYPTLGAILGWLLSKSDWWVFDELSEVEGAVAGALVGVFTLSFILSYEVAQ